MKKIALLLSIILIASATVFAQRERGSRNHRGNKARQECPMERGSFYKDLNLTADQKEKIKQINIDFGKEKSAIQRSRITTEMQNVKFKALGEKRRTDISNLLTTDQKKVWEERKNRQDCPMANENCPMAQADCPMMSADCGMQQNCCAAHKGKHARGKGAYNNSKGNRGHWGGSGYMLQGIELDAKQKDEFKKIVDSQRGEREKMQKAHQQDRMKLNDKRAEAVKKILTKDQLKQFEENQKQMKERMSAVKK